MSRHFLFIGVPDRGHLLPHLVVGKELARRGHRVDFVTTRQFAGLVESYGLTPLRYDPVCEDFPCEAAKPGPGDAAAMLVRWVDDSAAVIDAVESAYGDNRPDLIAYDSSSGTAGRILERKWGLPATQLCTAFAQNGASGCGHAVAAEPDARRQAELRPWADRVEALLAKHGLDTPFATFVDAVQDCTLVYVPKALQPAAERFDERFVFVGPCVDRRDTLTSWEKRTNGLPLVLVSLDTPGSRDTALLRTCIRAFGNAPVHVVLTVGDGIEVTALGELPPNIETYRWVSHAAVLDHASVVVTRGGLSGVTDALSAAVPVVAVPGGPVARVTGLRVEELGLGRTLPETGFDADRLRDTVLSLIGDREVARRLAWMRRQIEQAGGCARAATALEERARWSPPAR